MIVSVLRKEARQNLKGKWRQALLIMLVYTILTLLLSSIVYWFSTNTSYGGIITILNIVINVVLGYGLTVSFIRLKRNEKVDYFNFIYYATKDFKKVSKIIGRLALKLSAYFILLILFLYLTITELISLYYGYGMRLSYIVEILGVFIFTTLVTMKSLYYSLNNYILYDNKEYKTKEILKESERLMQNHRWDFFKMNLSFAGWIVLGIAFSIGIIALLFICSYINILLFTYIAYIPLIFIMPYMQVTTICFYDNLLHNNPKVKEHITNNKKKNTRKRK